MFGMLDVERSEILSNAKSRHIGADLSGLDVERSEIPTCRGGMLPPSHEAMADKRCRRAEVRGQRFLDVD